MVQSTEGKYKLTLFEEMFCNMPYFRIAEYEDNQKVEDFCLLSDKDLALLRFNQLLDSYKKTHSNLQFV